MVESAVAGSAIAVLEERDPMELMVREHARLVYRIAYSVLRNAADAEDATQETFVRVLRYGNRSRVTDPKAWIARIAWRSAVEKRTRDGRTRVREDLTEGLLSSEPLAERSLLDRERSQLLERLIVTLPEELREPLVLSTLEDMSLRDVAKVLGLSEAAVRSRTFRARQLLKEKLLAAMERGQR